MRKVSVFKGLFPILLIALLALPQTADARAGGGGSSGSRGSRTYSPSPSGAAPVQRSYTPQPPPQQPQQAPQFAPQRPAAPAYYPQPQTSSHPFLSGLPGGFAGMALGHMLFGSQGMAMGLGGGGMGGGMGGGGMGTPGLLHLLIIGGLIFLAFRVVRSLMGGGNGAGMPMPFAGGNNYAGPAMAQPQVQQPASQPLQLMESDAAAFSQLFLDIQTAWSHADLHRLQQDMTPEMVGYFNEQLSANSSRGVVNHVENVHIQAIDPVESWHEYNLDYASVKIRWTANDYMAPADAPFTGGQQPVAAPSNSQEQWTFVRSPGGRWLLSAIQQMG